MHNTFSYVYSYWSTHASVNCLRGCLAPNNCQITALEHRAARFVTCV